VIVITAARDELESLRESRERPMRAGLVALATYTCRLMNLFLPVGLCLVAEGTSA